jgi:hypothetical protein
MAAAERTVAAADIGAVENMAAAERTVAAAETGPADTEVADTEVADTGPADTGPADTEAADTEAVENMAAAEDIEAPADTGTADNMATAKRTVPLKGIEKADRKLAEVADWGMKVSKPVDLEALGALPTVVETHTPAKRQAA